MHMYFPVYSYTFTRSSDSLNLHIQICGYLLLIRFSGEDHKHLEEPEFRLTRSSFLGISLSLLYSIAFMTLYWVNDYSISFSYVIMCKCLYVTLQTIVIIQFVQVTLGLAYMRGVFFSRIYVADSRRDSVFTYFGKQDVIKTGGWS